MLIWLKNFLTALLWDETSAQRYLAGFFGFFGWVLTHGGAFPVPGIGEVILPGLAQWYAFGPYCLVIAFFLAAGSLPGGASGAAVAGKITLLDVDKKP